VNRARELLAATSIFGALSADTLTAVAEQAAERTYRKGQFVFQQGDPGDSCYLIDVGTVKVVTVAEDGTEVIHCTLGPGDCFGELSFFDGGERSAGVETLTKCRLVVLRKAALDLLLGPEPSPARVLLAYQAAIIRRLTEHAGDLIALDLPGRLAKCLDRLAAGSGVVTDAGARVELPLTQSDLAALVGASRPTVNQALQGFVKRGYLSVDGRTLIIHDLEGLRRRFGG
jgi:CRP-like cAMP-binding protein